MMAPSNHTAVASATGAAASINANVRSPAANHRVTVSPARRRATRSYELADGSEDWTAVAIACADLRRLARLLLWTNPGSARCPRRSDSVSSWLLMTFLSTDRKRAVQGT